LKDLSIIVMSLWLMMLMTQNEIESRINIHIIFDILKENQ
jgi:hypothetical protein